MRCLKPAWPLPETRSRSRRGIRASGLALVAVALLALLPATSWANRSDCFLDIPLLGFGSLNTPGGVSNVDLCQIQLPEQGQPTSTGSAYIEASHSYQTIQTTGGNPLPTDLPFQRSRIEVGLDNVLLDSNGAFGAAGIEIEQAFFGSHSQGQAEAEAFVQVTADFTIQLNPDASSVWQGAFGLQLQTPGGGFEAAQLSVDSEGNSLVPPGFMLQDLGNGLFLVTATVTSQPFVAPTDGTPLSYNLVSFGQAFIQPIGSTSIATGSVIIDSSNTVTSNVRSLDPNAGFTLGNPLASPEPAVLLLLGASAVVITVMRRRRS